MNEIIYRLRLDCSKPGTQASIYVKKGDIKSRKLSISLYNGSTPYEVPDGCSVVLRAKKPDATIVYDDCTVNGNVVTHLLTSKAVEVSGTVKCELTIYGPDSEVLFSPWFNLYVTDPLYEDDDVISTSEFSALTAAVSAMTSLANRWGNPSAGVKDGETPGVEVTISDNGVEFTFTLLKGDKGETGEKGATGETGATGAKGADGVSVTSVEQTTTSTADGGENIVTVTLSNGNTSTFKVKNGSKGSKGDTGKTGDKGETGEKGETGTGLDIKGTYATLDALEAAITSPAQGDMYNVGTAAPYNIYMWDETVAPHSWVDQGQLQGAKGEKGETGATGATGKDGKDGLNGTNGKDGVSVTSIEQTTTSTADGGENIVTVTLSNGNTSTFKVKNGSKGSKGDTGKTGDKGETGSTGATGAAGADGVSVTSVEQTTTSAADGGENIVTVTLSNGNTSTFKVKNGSKGSKGDTGKTGAVFTPSVSSAGVLSWSNNGELSNPASVDLVAAVIAALPSADSQAY